MRLPLTAAAALAAGALSAAGVSACGSSSKKSTSTRSTTRAPASTATAPAAPATLKVRVDGRTEVVKVAMLGFGYCRAHPRTCAAIKPRQEGKLTPHQRAAIAAARTKVAADEAAANQPAPQPEPAPAPAPEPPPSGGGETTTG